MTQDDMLKECRLDAKAFRENNTYDSDGNPIRLIAVSDRLDTYANWIAATDAENQRLRAEVEALREALEPSGDTKAAYMGEFSFPVEDMDDEGNEYTRKQYVPWTTIKEIMAAIVTRATRKAPQ